jgi:glycosyltransferase involved in cell wall biosynthesis
MIAHYGHELQVVVVDNTAWCASREKRTSGGSSDGEIRIGFLSNLSREKGLDIAIAVADAGRTAGLPLRLVLAGPTADAAAAESVRRATESMPDTIEYRGYVSGEEKERFFGDIDLFLFPSQYQNEAQPIVLLEAMSREIPVIASNVGFIPWLIEPCGTILPAGPAFRDAALSHLRYLAENREVLSSLGQAAKARFDDLKGHSESAFRAIFESSLRTSPVAS